MQLLQFLSRIASRSRLGIGGSHLKATPCENLWSIRSLSRAMPLDLASVSAQLELNDIPESAHEPGPGHYFGPDSQGFNAPLGR